MGNVSLSRVKKNKISERWKRRLARWQERRQKNEEFQALIASYQLSDLQRSIPRPPAEPPPQINKTNDIMTKSPFSDTTSVIVETVYSDDSSTVSWDQPPSLRSRYSSSDDGDSSTDYHTASLTSSFASALDSLTLDPGSASSSEGSIGSLGPPPPGSLMDLWNKPIPVSCRTNCVSDGPLPGVHIPFSSVNDSDSLSSMEYPGDDDDTYAEFNPMYDRPISSLQMVNATVRLNCEDSPHCYRLMVRDEEGQLVDTGGNFNMTNRRNLLVNVTAVKPFSIGMAAKESESTSFCTHRGDFPIQMLDGSVFYTPMYFNPQASDTILSPEAICQNSGRFLTHWTQSGSTLSDFGNVSLFTAQGAEIISLQLKKRNGLYYTTLSSTAVDSSAPPPSPEVNWYVYTHTDDPNAADDVSLDEFDPPSPTPAMFCGPPSKEPTMPPFTIPVPKQSRTANDVSLFPEATPKMKQIEADLWQARLGHCSEWQLKVLPMSADGTPSRFQPHPFSSYDVYNQSRIRKRPATRGKHPSRAVTRAQRLGMDFGFLRASNLDYSPPDNSVSTTAEERKKDRVVT